MIGCGKGIYGGLAVERRRVSQPWSAPSFNDRILRMEPLASNLSTVHLILVLQNCRHSAATIEKCA